MKELFTPVNMAIAFAISTGCFAFGFLLCKTMLSDYYSMKEYKRSKTKGFTEGYQESKAFSAGTKEKAPGDKPEASSKSN